MYNLEKLKTTLCGWWHLFIYKPGSKKVYWEKIIVSLIVIVGFFTYVFFNNKRLDRLASERKKFSKYAIGITDGGHNNIKGNLVVDYYFTYSYIKIKESQGTPKWFFGRPNTNGGRYYVLFAFNNPRNSEILFDKPVPDSIKNSPDNGWDYMPGYQNVK